MPVESQTARVGEPAPNFELTSTDGQRFSLSELRGKPVVLVFLRGFM
jgi:peroxiredoxin